MNQILSQLPNNLPVPLDDGAAAGLSALPHLRALNMTKCALTDAAMAPIVVHPMLSRLELANVNLKGSSNAQTGSSQAHRRQARAGFPALRELVMQVNNGFLAAIMRATRGRFPSLETLSISSSTRGSSWTPSGALVAPALKHAYFGRVKVNGSLAAWLAALSALKSLTLSAYPFSHFAPLPSPT